MELQRIQWTVTVTAAVWCAGLSLALPASAGPPAVRISAVALSTAWRDDGPRVAWIARKAGTTTLMLAALNHKNAHAVAIPGNCVQTGLRWANSGYGTPGVRPSRGYELAVMTHCTSSSAPLHSVIWLLDARHIRNSLRKVADVPGYAHCMQWTSKDEGIAFLYQPRATEAPQAAAPADCESRHLALGAEQHVAAVPVTGGKLAVITPARMNVYQFAWRRFGPQVVIYIAAPNGTSRRSARLYRKWGNATPGQWVIVDPATSPELRSRHLSMPSWGNYHPVVRFLGIENTPGTATGNWYRVRVGGGTPVNLTADTRLKPSWVDLFGDIGTRRAGSAVEILSIPGWRSGRPYRPTEVMFKVQGLIGDGRAPLAVSFAADAMAFAVRSPGSEPEVRVRQFRGLSAPSLFTFKCDGTYVKSKQK